MSYITCENLVLGYENQMVVENVNFKVNQGDYLCIMGENGAGKSTLMKTLLHLTKTLSGNLVYGDGLMDYEIGYLPQQTIVQRDFPASVWEIVLSGNISRLGFRPFYSKAEKKKAEEMLKKMGIWNLRNSGYRYLSGGQQQRVLLARALCATQKLILMDEPVSGLDPKVTAEFYQLIRNLNQDGVTIIMVSHDIHGALEDATHVLHIGKHEQQFYGTREEYMNSKAYKSLEIIDEIDADKEDAKL
ncbi:MAG: metal ABC transporter ATP-binding protein [Butyrivibrio sp.]|nr:metal ABC transporter ATP-binding protein [Butyrivibrio sp.]